LDGLVSHTAVAPLQLLPSSVHQQYRHEGGFCPAAQSVDGAPVPTVTQLLSALLHSCCTVQVPLAPVNVPYMKAQMSPISPPPNGEQPLSAQAQGRAYAPL
jgi:hypothetical protein